MQNASSSAISSVRIATFNNSHPAARLLSLAPGKPFMIRLPQSRSLLTSRPRDLASSYIEQALIGAIMSREVVVITGASAGIGRATARLFGKKGAAVGLIARNPEALEAAKREIEASGGRALVLPVDVADAKAVEAAAAKVEKTFGPIDIWVNDAMASVFSPVNRMTADDYRRVTEVTYLGYVYGTLAALKRMQSRNRGVIVQVGSALAYRSIPLQSAYCAAKHAIVGFTDSLRCELHHDKSKVRVTAVHMPALNTTQFDWVKSR